MHFSDTLKTLPGIAHLAGLQLLDTDGTVVATLENRPGQAGSVAIYHALTKCHDMVGPDAAQEGLALYCEHTADARAFPGKHPNIDRLLAIADGTCSPLQVRPVAAQHPQP
jgi:hypothetical protein